MLKSFFAHIHESFHFFPNAFFCSIFGEILSCFRPQRKRGAQGGEKKRGRKLFSLPTGMLLDAAEKGGRLQHTRPHEKKRTGKFYKPGGVFLAPFKGGGEGEGLRHMCLVFKKPKVFGGDVYLPYTVERSNNGRSSWDFCCFGSLSGLLI